MILLIYGQMSEEIHKTSQEVEEEEEEEESESEPESDDSEEVDICQTLQKLVS